MAKKRPKNSSSDGKNPSDELPLPRLIYVDYNADNEFGRWWRSFCQEIGEGVRQQEEALLEALFEDYEIPKDDPDRWRSLALGLAKDFHPWFDDDQKPPGAPRYWNAWTLYELRKEVERLIGEGHSAMGACRMLLKDAEGNWRYPRCRSAKTLYRRYQESKKPSSGSPEVC